MSGHVDPNPFLGPQPYRSRDSERFQRKETTRRLLNSILAHPCITLFGPSGAGKSSVMQAGVIPELRKEEHDFRISSVEGWPPDEEPLAWLARQMFSDLELGPVPGDMPPSTALSEALRLAERQSERPLLIYLDQLEQLFLPGREPKQVDAFFESLDELARRPFRGLQLVLALREDYLGRFRDRLRGRRVLLEQGFRLGPLTVGEMVEVVCWLATQGQPAQQWDREEMRELMLQVGLPGQSASDTAEVQAAFAQIVCRALWEERKRKGHEAGPVKAEPILHRYLQTTLRRLGPLRADARRLLEEHLVANDGSRTLLTEKQAHAVLPPEKAKQVLEHLEQAAVLRAEAHQGGRYFELGHDWLARKVFELKQERVRREESARSFQRERAKRRRLLLIAGIAVGVAVLTGGLFVWALQQRAAAWKAQEAAWKAQVEATSQAERAHDQSVMVGVREQMGHRQFAPAMNLLLEVKHPETSRDWRALAMESLVRSELEITLHHEDEVVSAAFSPDGQRIVTASWDKTARVWSADGKGTPIVLSGHENRVWFAAFSPDGGRIVTASRDKTARVWSADGKGTPIVLSGHGGPIRAAAFSPDGRRIVTASSDTTARVWSADGKGAPVVLSGHEDGVYFAAFSPDGQRIVTASWDRTARVWSADGQGAPVVLAGHQDRVMSAAFSPDGQHIVTASLDQSVRVWRADGKGEPVILSGHEGAVHSATFSPDGQRILTASEDKTARVWRADGQGAPVVLAGHQDRVWFAAFSPDGERIVTASKDKTARVWSSDGKGAPVVPLGYGDEVQFAAFSPDGERIVTASKDKTARVWSADGKGAPVVLAGHEGPLFFAGFSPEGERIVTASKDKTARVWSADGKGAPVVLAGHKAAVCFAGFSPDGQRIVTASWDRTVRVWSADGEGAPVVLSGHEDAVYSAAFSPDGQRIVTASADRTARVWSADGEGPPIVLSGHEGRVMSAAFSPDGQRIVTVSEDKAVRVWSADGKGAPIILSGHGDMILSVDFSPDGQRIVTASKDKTARIWSADGKGAPIILSGHGGAVLSADFSPDGQRIVTASADRTFRTWPLAISELSRRLREANHDCLLPELRQIYLGESDSQALKTYEECERSYGRIPSQPPFVAGASGP
ncbi:hypothetical protein BO221_23775 [Archangium sp. Cb G35]|uniref:WD40 repeat domain-containing protein n=1 Tax=Archangium sp. Cb G35 TaxID=1920190 RepID=UPI0009379D10|nr:WD40 repeat domain-containing protein [Archangium sp. Cb G35]OJT21797.1 hypothetical protein BO221_23775 [Archangium sp. Cb G35]